MEVLKNRKTAALILALVVVLSALLGGWRSLSALSSDVEKAFTEGEEGFSIQRDLNERMTQAVNLTAVAKRYLSPDDARITAVTDVRNALDAAKTPGEKYRANQQLSEAFSVLYYALEDMDLTEKDKEYRGEFYGEMLSRNDTISRDPYNEKAGAFNETLRQFPANLIGKLFSVSPAELYA